MVKVLSKVSSAFTPNSYDAWYWRYIPHYREIEDYPEDDKNLLSIDIDNKLPGEVQVTENDSDGSVSTINPIDYEFRDEANRKWWGYFNEYEYRYPKKVIAQKEWWRWFDKNMSKEEKKLVIKLDLLMVTFSIISYWAKYLDQQNIAVAYVSGMKEEIHMGPNDYSNAIAMYNAGSVIFQVIYMYLFPRVSLHFMFFAGDVIWSLITIFTAFVHDSQHLYAARFFIGAAEAGYFMMIHYLLGSWYKPDELGRRGGLYYTGQMLGILTAGLLQASIFETMNGHGGRSGWRWAFIIDGLITLPIGFVALYMVPGTPYNCTSLFLSDDDVRLARKRLKDANIHPPTKEPPRFLDKKLWKSVLTSWPIYALSILDCLFWNSGNTVGNGFAIWLKGSGKYTIPQVNRLTTIPPALGVGFILAVCFSADILRSRTIAIFWGAGMNFTGSVILAIWNVPTSAKWYAFYIGYFNITISSVIYGWLNDIMRHDPQKRSIVLCWANMFSNQSTAWVSRLTYPTSHAPRFKRGYTYSSIIDGLLISWVWVVLWFYKRQEKKDARGNGIVLYNTKTGDIPEDVAPWLDSEGKVKNPEDSDSSSISKPVA